MSEDQEKVLEWAVDTLRDAPDPALPDGFLSRFEERLAAEEETVEEPEVTRKLAPVGLTVVSSSRSQWYRVLAVAVAMIAVLGFFLLNPPRRPDPRTGILVVAASDQVEIQHMEVNQVRELSVGQTLRTGTAGEVVLMAETLGNEIRVAPESRLRIIRASRGTRVTEMDLDQGSVLIRESQTRIAVRTAHVVVTPIGTEYEVRHTGGSTEVTVFDGEVRVSEPGGTSGILVGKEQRIVVGDSTNWKDLKPQKFSGGESSRPELYGSSIDFDRAPRAGEELRPYPVANREAIPPAGSAGGKPARPAARPNAGATPSYPRARPTPARPRAQRTPAYPRANATPARMNRRPGQRISAPRPGQQGRHPGQQGHQPGQRSGPRKNPASRPGSRNQSPTTGSRPPISGQSYPTARPRNSGPQGQPGQTGPGSVRNPGMNRPRSGGQPGQGPRPGVRPGMQQPGQGPGTQQQGWRPRPGMRQPGQRPGVNQQGQRRRPGMHQPGQGPGVNQQGQGQRPGMQQPGQGSRPDARQPDAGMNQPGKRPQHGPRGPGQQPGMQSSGQGRQPGQGRRPVTHPGQGQQSGVHRPGSGANQPGQGSGTGVNRAGSGMSRSVNGGR